MDAAARARYAEIGTASPDAGAAHTNWPRLLRWGSFVLADGAAGARYAEVGAMGLGSRALQSVKSMAEPPRRLSSPWHAARCRRLCRPGR
jgi:hypothetical protein